MLDSLCSLPWHLQLIGSAPDQLQQATIGSRLFLPPGTFTSTEDSLGLTHLAAIPLPADVVAQRGAVISRYQLWDRPEGGMMLLDLTLGHGLILSGLISFLPPFLIRPNRLRQPGYRVIHQMQSNPCPGWSERVHVYADQSRPFSATAVAYLGPGGGIESAELFDVDIRPEGYAGEAVRRQRLWIAFDGVEP